MGAEPYRVAPPVPPDPYLVAWSKLRRRQRAAQLTIAGWIPVWFVCAAVPHHSAAMAALPMAFALVATVLGTQLRVTRFRCPGCHRPFVWSRPFKNDLRCWHCNLKFGTPSPGKP
jgi:hypothetical protein